jgi:hypothetical protein
MMFSYRFRKFSLRINQLDIPARILPPLVAATEERNLFLLKLLFQ